MDPLRGADGTLYVVQVYGRARQDGMWEGWLQFSTPTQVLRTARETTQSSADDLLYWATGLEPTYLEGAFQRARQ
ncbi:MAG: hypothetical protein JOY61_07890 [Chloroflexi bacterium]|nr:hypothetical protein [Chloroflexota bacterium]